MESSSYLVRPVLAPAIVEDLEVRHARALGEGVAVHDARHVAEDVLGAVVGLDEAEAARVPAEGDARRVALGRRPGVALRAARAAGLLGRAAGDVLRAVAARALVLALDEHHSFGFCSKFS